MTPLEIRKLIGGYATGSLSDTERQLLFEAALEDQELFDELMGEHGLKELLEEPGAKARLIAALAPASERTGRAAPVAPVHEDAPKPLWNRVWPWAAAAGAVAAGVVLSFALMRPTAPKQVARVFSPPPPRVVDPVPSPILAPPELRIETRVAPPRLEAAPNIPKAPGEIDRVAPVQPPQAAARATQPPPPAPRPSAPAPQAQQAVSGFVAGAATFASVARPDFIYTLSQDGKLRITPLVNGFLTVIANQDRIVASNREVETDMSVEFTIPEDANVVSAFLTPQPSPPLAPPQGVQTTRIPVKPGLQRR